MVDELHVWASFWELIIARFRAVNAIRHARDQLASLRQTGSVQDYVTRFH